MNIISIIDSHTASAALVCDNKLEVLVSEERFTRKKSHICYPKHSIDYCITSGSGNGRGGGGRIH